MANGYLCFIKNNVSFYFQQLCPVSYDEEIFLFRQEIGGDEGMARLASAAWLVNPLVSTNFFSPIKRGGGSRGKYFPSLFPFFLFPDAIVTLVNRACLRSKERPYTTLDHLPPSFFFVLLIFSLCNLLL